MTGKTHLVTGLTTGLIFIQMIPATPIEAALIVGACTLGSLAPDLDHPNSIIHKFIPLMRWTSLITGHRGILHSLIAPLLIASIYWTQEPIKAVFHALDLSAPSIPEQAIMPLMALATGWLSHLLLDALTPRGVPLFLPYPASVRLLPRIFSITTGGFFEFLFLIGMIALCVLVVISLFK